MDVISECRAQRILVREAINIFKDDHEVFDLENRPLDHLRQLIDQAKKYKSVLAAATAILEDSDTTYGPPLQTDANLARRGLADYISQASKKVFEMEKAEKDRLDEQQIRRDEAAATAAREAQTPTASQLFKASKVKAYQATTINSLSNLGKEITVLFKNKPENEKGAKILEDKLSSISKRAETAVKDGRSLAADAADASDLAAAESLEQEVRNVLTATEEAMIQLSDLKIGLGVLGHGGSLKGDDLEPPKFTGDLEVKDYFSWAKELDDYFESKNLNHAQQLSVIKRTCLQGTPATACAEMTTKEEILKFLKSFYGNAGLMLDAKLRDFRKLGKCSGNAAKRRDWIVKAKQKLEFLHKLAIRHEIHNYLYFSPLTTEVLNSLTYDAQKNFREKMDDQGVSVFDKEEMFKQLVYYLTELETKINYQVQFEVTMGTARPDEKAQGNPKKSYHARGRQQVVELDSECSEEDEEEVTV
jgi:hypothetical protein